VPIDFSETSDAALDTALYLAEKLDAELVVMHAYELPTAMYSTPAHVPPPPEMFEWMKSAAEGGVKAAVEKAKARVPNTIGVVRSGKPWREIESLAATTGADLVVMGTHGRTGVSRALLGSVAEKVVRTATVPVLTVHAPASERSEQARALGEVPHT
jgi:nucleotide-binding universal stress UspA family protein